MNGLASLFGLDHKIALVTGGAQGMGRMIAAGLISAGAKVYITSRKAEICEATARELSQSGQCVGIPADLNTPEAVVALAAQIKGREPSLDILINNAGRTWGAPLETFPVFVLGRSPFPTNRTSLTRTPNCSATRPRTWLLFASRSCASAPSSIVRRSCSPLALTSLYTVPLIDPVVCVKP